MAAQADPMAEALARIAQEREERTGVLDLTDLNLEEVPEELSALTHLRVLELQRFDRSYHPILRLQGLAKKLPDFSLLEVLQLSRCDLQQIDCIAALEHLREFDCSGTSVSDLTPLAKLVGLQQLVFCRTPVSNLTPLKDLSSLRELICSNTSISDLAPLASLSSLQQLDCSGTSVLDLTPLANLTNLQNLDCSSTSVSDLAPLAQLFGLKQLDCYDNTSISDLAPLANLSSLQKIDCHATSILELTPLQGLSRLHQLDCSYTSVSDLTPLEGLSSLRQLSCSNTSVSDLAPLKELSNLRQLVCFKTFVSDLAPLEKLTNLQLLNCFDTHVSDLTPLKGLTSLQLLNCSYTSASDLTPLAGMTDLLELNCSGCRLEGLPIQFLEFESLQTVTLNNSHIRDVPREILSKHDQDNCLARLRRHFDDLAIEATSVTDIRVLFVGNGCVGKTQMAGWLSDAPFEDSWNSTHGIRIADTAMTGDPETRLHLWDFGGQDIYHSTHSLFLRHPAVLVAVWSHDREVLETYEHGGLAFRNHPLGYWIDTLRQQADPDSPLLIVQNKCDLPGEGARRLPVADATLDALPFAKILQVSAKNRRGEGALNDALEEAVAWLRDPARLGTPRIGARRLRVQRRLEAMRLEDAARAPVDRLHRYLEHPEFEALCKEEGGVSSPEMLLDYLNANGTVLYRPGLFRERIVLDHAWALEAIYSVFERKSDVCRLVRGNLGRFTPLMLAGMIWRDREEGERRLFLDLMRSCGICFRLREGVEGDDWFIAPDLLPERESLSVEIDGRWDRDAPCREARFAYVLLHGGLVRAIMAEIGDEAGLAALYWRGGLCGYEARTRSRFMIEEVPGGGWAGALRVATQGGQADRLLDSLCERVERAQSRVGMRPLSVERPSALAETKTPPLTFAQEKPAMLEWYVSYAWKDDKSDEGRKREEKVDAFCAEAETRGHRVQRDKTGIALGESISAFMQRLAAGDRIFVFLSDRYLRSTACMFELFAIWRRSQQEPAQFLDRIRVFTLDGADIWSPKGRVGYAGHWLTQCKELEEKVNEFGLAALGNRDHATYHRMVAFQHHVGDILAVIADIRQPRKLDELFEYGFD